MGKKVGNHKNVIVSMPEPQTWTFMSFVTDAGRDVTEVWDTDQTDEAFLGFQSMVRNSRKIADHLTWPAWRHVMNKEAGKAGVIELGFTEDGKPYRFLCIFKGRKCIVVLCIAYHKGKVWKPHDAVAIATKRAKIVTAGKARLNVIQIEDDL
jgi:hypothetical protein